MKNSIVSFLAIFIFSMPAFGDSYVHVKKITIQGNTVTKEKIILRELTVKQGDSLLKLNLQYTCTRNERNIFNLLLFRSVACTVQYYDSVNVELIFKVVEKRRLVYFPAIEIADRNFNVWFKEYHADLNRLNYGIGATYINLFGKNQTLKCSTQVGFKKYLELQYIVPHVNKKLNSGLAFMATYSTGKQLFFDVKENKQIFFNNPVENVYSRLFGQVDYIYRPGVLQSHKFTWSLTHWTINQKIADLNSDFFGNNKLRYTLPEFSYSYVYNRVNDLNYPVLGRQMKIVLGRRGLPFSEGSVNQNYIYLYWARYLKHNKFSLAMVSRNRIASNKQQPFIANRALGFDADYVRGFEYYVIDGHSFTLQKIDLRYNILKLSNSKIRLLDRHMPLYFYPKIFVDYGYVKGENYNNGYLNNSRLWGYGIGLDVYFRNTVKFRIEHSFNNLKQHDTYFHTIN